MDHASASPSSNGAVLRDFVSDSREALRSAHLEPPGRIKALFARYLAEVQLYRAVLYQEEAMSELEKYVDTMDAQVLLDHIKDIGTE